MESFLRDLLHGFRMMRRTAGATAVAVSALGLGIGANTAIFSVVNTVLLRALPYKDPDRLVQVWGSMPSKGIPYHNVTYSDVSDWRQSRTLESIEAGLPGSANLTTAGGEPERLALWRVNAGFFPLLGARFLQGRGFSSDEDRPGAARVAVLSYALWQRRFGSDVKVIGSTARLDGNPYTVVGVLPRGFDLAGRSVDLYTPLGVASGRTSENDGVTVMVFARLKPGVSIAQAQAEMDTIGRRLEQYPGSLAKRPRMWGFREFLVRDVRLSLLVLLGAVGLVLLIACANVAILLLARAGARQKEIALRAALGASRGRLLRQLLAESSLLGLAGGALGVGLAQAGVHGLLRFSPERYPLLRDTTIDAPVLAFTLVVSLVTGLLFGLVPALASARTGGLYEALQAGGRGASGGFGQNRLRSLLVVSEMALALVLLTGAGLLIRSFARLQNVDPGFRSQGVLTAAISLPSSQYSRPAQRVAFFEQLLQRLEGTPGVRAAGMVSALPLGQSDSGTSFVVEGRPFPRPGEAPIVWFRSADAGYFRAMEIPLRKGRLFTERDDQSASPVALVNETVARRFWPGEDPVGKRFITGTARPGQGPIGWITVVGVVGDLRHRGLSREPQSEMFWSYRQVSRSSMALAIQVADPVRFVPSLRAATVAMDKTLPVSQVRSMEQILDDSIAPERFSTLLLGLFATVALALAAVGIYGVISFSVARRTQEIGVRMALGAQPGDVLRMIVCQALTLALIGVALGLAGARALTRVMASLLFGVSPTDPVVFGGVAALLTAVAVVASYLPARRAARVDPMVALRYE